MKNIEPFPETIQVLIVDDNTDNCFCLGFAMKSWNVESSAALNGEQALEKMMHQRFDLVLMDMRMPGLSGNETIAKIRSNPDLRDTIIIAVTANVFPGAREECLANGADEYISKPIDLKDLQSKMHLLAGARV